MEQAVEILERIRKDRIQNGIVNTESSYNCPICKDVGVVRVVRNGVERWRNCQCTIEKINKQRLLNSGLINVMEKYTFDTYAVKEKWQKSVKAKAQEYAQNPTGWFFIGGSSGAGKTHICTAICGELIANRPIRYMPWVQENNKLKTYRNSEEEYDRLVNVWKRADVLYIDDFLKTRKGTPVTGADVMTAYEILNYRYMQGNSITIISSELSCDEIMEIDMAVGGRIIEKTKGNMIFLAGTDKNQRLR